MKSNLAAVGCSIILSVTTLPACSFKHPTMGTVTSYGLMKSVPESERAIICYSLDARSTTNIGRVVTQKTDKIPARRNVQFGIKFVLSGDLKNSYFKYRRVVTHPPMELPTGKTSTEDVRDLEGWTCKETVSAWTSMTFDEDYKIVTGRWTFEIWSEGRQLIEKEFTVVSTEVEM